MKKYFNSILKNFVPPLKRANLPPDSRWRQFASSLPNVVGPALHNVRRTLMTV